MHKLLMTNINEVRNIKLSYYRYDKYRHEYINKMNFKDFNKSYQHLKLKFIIKSLCIGENKYSLQIILNLSYSSCTTIITSSQR